MFEFNRGVRDWQFGSCVFNLSDNDDTQNRTPEKINVYINYCKQVNTANFDNFSLIKEPVPTYEYDVVGNPVEYLGDRLTWTMGRQLAEYRITNGTETQEDDTAYSYTYNEDGIRTSKTVDNVKTEFYLDGTNIIEQITGDTVLHFHYDSNDEVIGFTYNEADYFYVKNSMGDITGITDINGNLVASYTYDPWGKVLDDELTAIGELNPFRYRSYYYDVETELYYLQSRYYDPEVGRFINSDDVSFIGATSSEISYNPFAYCENNPVNHLDLNGTSAIAILVAIGILVGGLAGYGLSRILKVPKEKRWKYVLGGAVIGGIIGGCVGYVVGASAAGGSGIVLWSGGGVNGAGAHAANFAAKNGLRTLEMTKKGKFLSNLNSAAIKVLGKNKGYKFMKPLWNAASKQFVKSAVGKQTYVNVFISLSQFSKASVFAEIEYKVLVSCGMKIIWHFVE